MDDRVSNVGAAFTRWADLTDAYAKKVSALQRGEVGARADAARLAREILDAGTLAYRDMAPGAFMIPGDAQI